MKYVMLGNPEEGTLETFHLIIAPTYDCNLSCKHCYNEPIKNGVSLGQWKGVIDRWSDFVRKESKDGITHFKGGEPFVYTGLDELLGYSADRGLLVFVTSNGTLIGDEQAKNLGNLYKKTKGKIILSLNGSTAETDGLLRQEGIYQKTVEAARRLKENNVPFDINCVFHSGNEEDIENAIYLAKELGAVQFNLLPLVRRGSARKRDFEVPKLSDRVLEQLKRARSNGARDMLEWSIIDVIEKVGSGEYECNGCTAGFRGFAYITPDGNVYSCPNTVFEEYKLGTIDDSPEAWFESKGAKTLRKIHQGTLVCKGELEAYGNGRQPESFESLLYSDDLIKQKINEIESISEDRKPIAVCFNRNF